MRFLIDEDLPRSVCALLIQYGHDAIAVRDLGMRGAKDYEIASIARQRGLCILTGDFDFADVRNYPPANYAGIVVLSIPNFTTSAYIHDLLEFFLKQDAVIGKIVGRLAIVEPDRIRFRER